MIDIKTLIWVSAKPLLKLTFTTTSGYLLAKMDLFPIAAARGAGQLILNILLPALLFSKIILTFTADNIGAFGVLLVVTLLYQLYGFAFSWLIKKVFWVPRRFRYGILVAGAWGNWADVPTAVIMSITASAPFQPGDSDVAVAYVSVFVFIALLTLFPLGGHRLVAKDYPEGGMPPVDEEIPVSPLLDIIQTWRTEKSPKPSTTKCDVEALQDGDEKIIENSREDSITTKRTPFSTLEHESQETPQPEVPSPSVALEPTPTHTSSPSQNQLLEILSRIYIFILSLLTPCTISMLAALVTALVPSLKALFIAPSAESSVHIKPAPDGLPPLDVLFETATFAGNACIPLGLVCLGSALARLRLPRPIRKAPLGAIMTFAIFKMIGGPVFGVLLVQGLTKHTNLIDEGDKVLQFVCIFMSSVPTATTQLYLTQVYSPDGSADDFSAFLIPQYGLMLVTMTALSAYSLNLLF
ncbi:auxin efflux carrier [Ceratobasidium sp. AG-I]|nr:auxin efflux carrier [Ceratobasidium sp. AG-I]